MWWMDTISLKGANIPSEYLMKNTIEYVAGTERKTGPGTGTGRGQDEMY